MSTYLRKGFNFSEIITKEEANEIQKYIQSLVHGRIELFYPLVMISYATSPRPNDAPGTGVGILYANEIIKALLEKGIQCFSGLHVPAGTDWETYMLRILGSSKSQAVIMIVIQTDGLYKSKACLREIEAAIKAKLHIIPVRFEEPLPKKDDQWPDIFRGNNENEAVTRWRVQDSLGKLNSLPPRGTFISDPTACTELVAHVEKKLKEIEHSTLLTYGHLF